MSQPPSKLTLKLRKIAEGCGAIFGSRRVLVPLEAFRTPGVFAAIRSLAVPIRCPECGHPSPERFGISPHGEGVQRFRCRWEKRDEFHRRKVCGGFFTEYVQTPLAGHQLMAHQWLAVWHLRHERSGPHLSVRAIARQLGLSPSNIHRVVAYKQGFLVENRGSVRRTIHKKDWHPRPGGCLFEPGRRSGRVSLKLRTLHAPRHRVGDQPWADLWVEVRAVRDILLNDISPVAYTTRQGSLRKRERLIRRYSTGKHTPAGENTRDPNPEGKSETPRVYATPFRTTERKRSRKTPVFGEGTDLAESPIFPPLGESGDVDLVDGGMDAFDLPPSSDVP